MYRPEAFDEPDVAKLHQLIQSQPLAAVVTLNGDCLEASHVPLVLYPGEGEFGTLRGHLARANTQWRSVSSDVEALCIFSGPDAYISPSWYPSKQDTGKVVPTWNYVTVHDYGQIQIQKDRDWLLRNVNAITDQQEGKRQAPWRVSDAPVRFTETMLRGIVGIEIEITRLEGKWKVSQNRPAADRVGVIEGLKGGGPDAQEMADILQTRQVPESDS